MVGYYAVTKILPVDGRNSFWLVHYLSRRRARRVENYEDLPRGLRRTMENRCIIPTYMRIDCTKSDSVIYRIAEF